MKLVYSSLSLFSFLSPASSSKVSTATFVNAEFSHRFGPRAESQQNDTNSPHGLVLHRRREMDDTIKTCSSLQADAAIACEACEDECLACGECDVSDFSRATCTATSSSSPYTFAVTNVEQVSDRTFKYTLEVCECDVPDDDFELTPLSKFAISFPEGCQVDASEAQCSTDKTVTDDTSGQCAKNIPFSEKVLKCEGLQDDETCWTMTFTVSNVEQKFGARISTGFAETATDCGTCQLPGPKCPLPTEAPSSSPSAGPTPGPSSSPSVGPTSVPSSSPSAGPTGSPTPGPTPGPTPQPTPAPSSSPSAGPTGSPTPGPTPGPTLQPTPAPSSSPSAGPTGSPTPGPTPGPTPRPTTPAPTQEPTPAPSSSPSAEPTGSPTPEPTFEPTSSPTTNPLCLTDVEATCTLLDPREDGTLIPCRDAPIVDGVCSTGTDIEVVSFTYLPAPCTESDNNQGPEASCTDFVSPIPDGTVTVSCVDVSAMVGLETTPSIVSPGDEFVVSTTTTDVTLPDKISCTIGEGTTVYQTNVIDVSGEVRLELKDTFGTLQLQSCDDDDCVEEVIITYTVTNIGPVDMNVTSVLGQVINNDTVSNDEIVELVEFVNPNPVPVGQIATTKYRTKIDFCVGQVIDIKGSVTALPET
eukprot:scaffold46582_cov214-Amphora_coffeaeformis.AAC.2